MFLDKIEENSRYQADYVVYSDEIHPKGITNSELWEQSSRIYAYLKEKGIGRENFVMVHLPRGYDFCTAMVGVWRAGAAVVVLEDTYASERVSYIYRDCNCVFEINSENWAEILSHPVRDGREEIHEHDAAFAVYTSGSTGKPKGVLHEFGNLERIIKSMYLEDGSFIIEEDDQVALLIPLNFVAFLLFVCGSLYFGKAHSWIVSFKTVKNRRALASFFLSQKINFTFLTPSYVRVLGTTGPYLTKLLVGSEPANGIYKKNIRIYNVYAMSESGFPASIFLIDKKYDMCPIGKTGSSSQLHFLDDQGNEVQAGEVGEICFENPFVRGYINLPDQTETAFKNGLYHTNDLGKVTSEGFVLYMGRKDDMVKIDGNRVEPGEIENVCKEILKLKDCVAKGFEKEETVALYYTDKKEINAQAARELLSAYLPYYMIPSHYYHLEELPKNSFGKVMRKDLKLQLEKHQEYIAPRNDFEKKLTDAFSSVLGISEIGIRDDFFQMGGSSLNAIELISFLEDEKISAELLYELRTVEALSDYLTSGKKPAVAHRKAPSSLLYGVLRFAGWILSHFVFHRTVLRNEIKDVETPYVILANHEAALDFFNLIGLTRRKLVPVMSASYYYTMPFPKLGEKLGFIAKQQSQTDFADIMKMKEVTDSGQPLVLYPAGIQPCDGISTAISSQTWRFLKMLGVDVYVARTVGTYFVKPKWASSYRPGRTSIDVWKLFTKEELKEANLEEIGGKVLNALEFDAYREQDERRWIYKKNTVEGLQNVLYICPDCKSEYTMNLKDPYTLECSCCGFTQISDSLGMMHNEKCPSKEIRYVSDWSKQIHKELERKIECGLSIQEPVSIHTINHAKHRFMESGSGTLSLDNDWLILDGTLYGQKFTLRKSACALSVVPVQPGKYFEIQDKHEIYRCYLENRSKTTQIADLLTILGRLPR